MYDEETLAAAEAVAFQDENDYDDPAAEEAPDPNFDDEQQAAAEEEVEETAAADDSDVAALRQQLEAERREKAGLYARMMKEREGRQSLADVLNERLARLEQALTPQESEEPPPPLEGPPDAVADGLAERFRRRLRPDLDGLRTHVDERLSAIEQREAARQQQMAEAQQADRIQQFLTSQRSQATDDQRSAFDAREREIVNHYLSQGLSQDEAEYWTGHYFHGPAVRTAIQTGKPLYQVVYESLGGSAELPASPPAAGAGNAPPPGRTSPQVRQHRSNVAAAPKPAPAGRPPEQGESLALSIARATSTGRMTDEAYAEQVSKLAKQEGVDLSRAAEMIEEAGMQLYAQTA